MRFPIPSGVRGVVWLLSLLALLATAAGCSTSSVARSDLPIKSDFSECDDWSTDDNEHITLSCDNGQYHVLYKDTSTEIHDYMLRRSDDPIDSVGVEADVSVQAAPGTAGERLIAAGLGCWISGPAEPARGYVFEVLPEPAFAILKVDETDKTAEKRLFLEPLVDEDSAAVKGIGEVNHVRGECRHTGSATVEAHMWVNGEEVGSATDPSGFFGYEAFGFATYATEDGTDMRFDNFLAEELQEQS